MPGPGSAPAHSDGVVAADRVLRAVHRPYDPAMLLSALLGLAPVTARRIVGAVVATGPEAEALLGAMPRTVRSLAMATTDTPVRCAGEVRGPVLWAETMAARASVAGDPGIVVCASPSRAFDTAENRVLVTALETVLRAARDAEGLHRGGDLTVIHRARHNAHVAQRYLDHQALTGIPRGHLGRRSRGRARSGTRRGTYRPAIRLLERSATPLDGRHLEALGDAADLDRFATLAALIDAAEGAGARVEPLRTHHGELVSGPLRYRHPDQPQMPAGPPGIWVGPTEVRHRDDLAAGVAALSVTASSADGGDEADRD